MNDKNILLGWIKIFRSTRDHWIWTNSSYFKAWITILMEVNFEDKKALVEGELIDCKRGQCLYSIQTWTTKFGFGWTIQKTRTFFNLLKKDKMIVTEGLRKTTRLTVCNYDFYQENQLGKDNQKTLIKQSTNNQKNTTKEFQKNKNLNNKRPDFYNRKNFN